MVEQDTLQAASRGLRLPRHPVEEDLKPSSGLGQVAFRLHHRDVAHLLAPEPLPEDIAPEEQDGAQARSVCAASEELANPVGQPHEVVVDEREADEQHVPRHEQGLNHAAQRPVHVAVVEVLVPRQHDRLRHGGITVQLQQPRRSWCSLLARQHAQACVVTVDRLGRQLVAVVVVRRDDGVRA